jgi:two-component system, OmpR family, sensor histidine kinase VanS
MRVLIVEDEPFLAEAIRDGLRLEAIAADVENTGAPLTAQSVATLAEPSQRGAGRRRTDHAGVGLGLAIVQSIVRAHDGTLALEPRAAGGLRVTVRLPAGAAEEAGPSRTVA